jgi:tRNA (cmo5U34)-methyltransferase
MRDVKDKQSWDEQDSIEFIQDGAVFVPDREEQIDLMADLIPPTHATGHVVDLCCGEGLLSLEILRRHPNVTVRGYDGSPRMLAKAKETVGEFRDRFDDQLFDLAKSGWRTFPWGVHAFVSSLAIHHLDGDGKKALFASLLASLLPGGILIVADLVEPTTTRGRELAAKAWDRTVRERSMRMHGDLSAFERFQAINWNYYGDPNPSPLDIPSTLAEQIDWLRLAGFVNVDVHWMKAGHAIFSGLAPVSTR